MIFFSAFPLQSSELLPIMTGASPGDRFARGQSVRTYYVDDMSNSLTILRYRNLLSGFCLSLGVVLFMSACGEASIVVPELPAYQIGEAIDTTGSGDEAVPSGDSEVPSSDESIPAEQLFGANHAPLSSSSSSSSGGGHSGGSPSLAFTFTTADGLSNLSLVGWLSQEGRLMLPRPTGNDLLRPPQA